MKLSSVVRSTLKMRLVQYSLNNVQYLGAEVKENGDIILIPNDQFPYKSTVELLRAGRSVWDQLQKYIDGAKATIARKDVKFLSPITNPDKVICVGLNYRDHCLETNSPIPKQPVIFNKFPSSITGPYDDIILSKETNAVDWEVELVVVIGKGGKNIQISEAVDHVFGYTVANDVSARDWQLERNGGQWLLGKTMDTFCPLGPSIVTAEHIKNPHLLSIKSVVNGAVKQNSSTKELVHDIPTLISYISRFATLLPGDIILTGTPAGVGFTRKPPELLKPGDVVECQIESIGSIVNKVVE